MIAVSQKFLAQIHNNPYYNVVVSIFPLSLNYPPYNPNISPPLKHVWVGRVPGQIQDMYIMGSP